MQDIGKAELHKDEKGKGETLESFSSANTMKEKESNDESNKGFNLIHCAFFFLFKTSHNGNKKINDLQRNNQNQQEN